jgi:general secretion pathway protein I
MHSEDAKDSGFTLLEVLVAFLILAAALVAANQSLSYSLRSFASAKMSRAADRAAEAVLAEHVNLSSDLGEESGVTADGQKWTLKFEPFALKVGDAEITAEKLTLDIIAPTDGHTVRRYVTYRSVQTADDANAR